MFLWSQSVDARLLSLFLYGQHSARVLLPRWLALFNLETLSRAVSSSGYMLTGVFCRLASRPSGDDAAAFLFLALLSMALYYSYKERLSDSG